MPLRQQMTVVIPGLEPYQVDRTRDKFTLYLSMNKGNGAWLNGKRLEPGTRVYRDGVLVHSEPTRPFAFQGSEPMRGVLP